MEKLNSSLVLGDIITFDDKDYKVVENRFLKGKKSHKLLIWLNIISFVFIFLLFLPWLFIRSKGITIEFNIFKIIISIAIIIIAFIVYIFVHEAIHGLSYHFFGKVSYKNLKYGFNVHSMVAYCISRVPVDIKSSRLTLMMPLYVCAIPLYIIALITGNLTFFIATIIMISGSVADIWYMYSLRKISGDMYMIETMPIKGYDIGYYLMEKQ